MTNEQSVTKLEKGLNEKIKFFFGQEYFGSRIILWLFVSSCVLNLISWTILPIFLQPAGDFMILHYNVYFGVDSVGGSKQAYLLPLIGVIIFAINALLSIYFYIKKERIASYVLLLTALMAQLSLLISIISVIIINY